MTYRVHKWRETFETRESRRLKNRLAWVAVPTRHDGCGYRTVIETAPDVYAAWVLILQVAAKMPTRGVLETETGPLGSEQLARRTGAPKELFERALELLTRPDIGWLEIVPDDESAHDMRTTCAPHAHPVYKKCAAQNSTEQTKKEPSGPARSDPAKQQKQIKKENKERKLPNGDDSPAVAATPPTGPGFSQKDLPGRAGKTNDRFRQTFCLRLAEAFGLAPGRTLGQRKSFNAVARRIQDRPDRKEIAATLIALAAKKRAAGLDNPMAAWQSAVDGVLAEGLKA